MKLLFLLILFPSALILSGARRSQSPDPTPSPRETGEKEQEIRNGKSKPTDADRDPSKPPPSLLNQPNTQERNAESSKTSEKESEPSSTNWWIMAFTGSLATVGILQLGILAFQILLLRKGLKINKMLERAWLSVTFDSPLDSEKIDSKGIEFTIRNHGHSVAFIKEDKLRGKSWEGRSNIPDRPLDPKPSGKLPTKFVLFPNQSMITQGPLGFELTPAMINGGCIFDVYGYVAYDDIFDVRHITRFCQVYNYRTHGFDFPREAKPGYNDAD